MVSELCCWALVYRMIIKPEMVCKLRSGLLPRKFALVWFAGATSGIRHAFVQELGLRVTGALQNPTFKPPSLLSLLLVNVAIRGAL